MTPTTAARAVFDVVQASGATPSALAARRRRRTEDLLSFVRRQSRFYADHYADVPAGEPSDTVLLTNLANRVQPIVRYDLGDSVTLHEEPCPCGSPFPVVDIAGRQGEVLRFETDDGEPVPVFPLALSSVVEAVPGVRRTQIVRTGRVRLDVAADHDEATVRERVDAELRAFFAERSVTDLTVEWAATPPQREPGGGKFRHVWSDLASAPRD